MNQAANPFQGVLPALTTPLTPGLEVDAGAFETKARWMVDCGARGLVPHGSLGEGATLSFEEKVAVQQTCVAAAAGRVPVIPGIASLSTAEAVALAREAERVGCGGLMVLPPYVYSTDWREMKAHVAAVLSATALPCMLYNNPPAYKTDFLPEHVAELAAEFPRLLGVKESSGDARRVTALRAALPERVAIGVGLDDLLVEGVAAGATFWVAGLVNALPEESVALFDQALVGGPRAASELYRWFLPLLRLDTGPKFVQLIKLVEERLGLGSERVRPPRLSLVGAEREAALAIVDQALATRPLLVRDGR